MDIVERLRATPETGADPDMIFDAADEIERLRAALADLISGDVGRQTMEKLATGQGTDTDDGHAWLRASEMVRPNLF